MATEGPLAREVADLRLRCTPCPEPTRATRSPSPRAGPPGATAPRARRPAARSRASSPPSPPSTGAHRRRGVLTDAGYAVEEVDLPLFAEAYRLWYLLTIEDNRRDLPVIRELGGEGALRSFDTELAVARQWWSPSPTARGAGGYDLHGRLIRQLGEVLASCRCC